MRPSAIFLVFLGVLTTVDGALLLHRQARLARAHAEADTLKITVAGLGITDLSLATEARYTRHPAISDPLVPIMDHPGAIDHFPSGSFWTPPIVQP